MGRDKKPPIFSLIYLFTRVLSTYVSVSIYLRIISCSSLSILLFIRSCFPPSICVSLSPPITPSLARPCPPHVNLSALLGSKCIIVRISLSTKCRGVGGGCCVPTWSLAGRGEAWGAERTGKGRVYYANWLSFSLVNG